MKITPAVRRALGAVLLGEVVRTYSAKGNVLRGPKGVGSAALWTLDRREWVTDTKHAAGDFLITRKQVLTKAGRDALAATD